MNLNVDSFNRLSLGLIEKFNVSPDAALQRLETLQLKLVCSEEIASSIPLQAAFITAVNTAKRAFLGGVYVEVPLEVECLLPWPGKKRLHEVALELGGTLPPSHDNGIFTLTFGMPASIDDNSMQVACNGWQGGVLVDSEVFDPGFAGNIPTAGIFAGGLGVALAFFRAAGINISACDHSVGLSLWRPDLPWLVQEAKGPQITFLPARYWLLGLGHLGQAYLWNIGLLPYPVEAKAEMLLHDFDCVVAANWSAGLLCDLGDAGQKTRLCSRWLENRGFKTVISERLFHACTRRAKDESFLALCGFDNAEARHHLESAGFDLIVEAGLGGGLQTFDLIALHTFPGAKPSKELWPLEAETITEVNKKVLDVLNRETQEMCGIVPLTIAEKSLSASFVGACTAALVVAEVLRALHGGYRYDKIVVQLRNLKDTVAVINENTCYTTQLSRNGWFNL